VVGLADQREPVTVEPLDHPDLPHRPLPIERLGHDAADQALQHALVAGPRQRGVTHVVGEAEAVVVDPDGNALVGDLGEPLAKARHEVEAGVNRRPDAVDVDAAAGRAERCRVEDEDGSNVHVAALVLDAEEGSVHRAQALVGGHGAPPGCAA